MTKFGARHPEIICQCLNTLASEYFCFSSLYIVPIVFKKSCDSRVVSRDRAMIVVELCCTFQGSSSIDLFARPCKPHPQYIHHCFTEEMELGINE